VDVGPLHVDLNFNMCICPDCLGVHAVAPLMYGDN
jgi:hypothetical protein